MTYSTYHGMLGKVIIGENGVVDADDACDTLNEQAARIAELEKELAKVRVQLDEALGDADFWHQQWLSEGSEDVE